MIHRLRTRFFSALMFAMLICAAMVPAASAQQVTAPPEGEDYSPWNFANQCISEDGVNWTCTWLVESGVRERVEGPFSQSCNLGWSHRKAEQTVTTTITESYEQYRVDLLYDPWRGGGKLKSYSFDEETVLISSVTEYGECRPITGRPPAN